MASSWFLVLVPTEKYESELRTRFKRIDSSSVKVPPININVVDETTKDDDLEGPPITPILRSNVANFMHQNTQESKRSTVTFREDGIEEFDEDTPYFESDLQDVLKILEISQATYQQTSSGNFHLVSFFVQASNVEVALIELQDRGIGNTELTSISVIPTSVHLDNPIEFSECLNEIER